MKKLICVVIILALTLTGCASGAGSGVNYTEDANGNTILSSSYSNTTMIDTLPYDVMYNGDAVSLSSVDLYEYVVDYSYNLFIVVTFDCSGLNDSDFHWRTESDMEVRAYLQGENTENEFSVAPILGRLNYTDAQKAIYVFTSSFFDENRKSFSGSSITVTASVKQEGEDTPREELHYTSSVPQSLPDSDEIPSPLSDYVAKWLHEKVKTVTD